jgi:hypothetical protein
LGRIRVQRLSDLGSMLWSQFSAIFGEKNGVFLINSFIGENIFLNNNIGPADNGCELWVEELGRLEDLYDGGDDAVQRLGKLVADGGKTGDKFDARSQFYDKSFGRKFRQIFLYGI